MEKDYTALMYASDNGNKEVVELLLSKSANINAHTALMIASKNGHKEIVELLLSNGANVNAENNYDETAVHIASKNGHKEIIELLLSNGAKMEDTLWSILLFNGYLKSIGHKDYSKYDLVLVDNKEIISFMKDIMYNLSKE